MPDFIQQHLTEVVIGGFLCLDAIIFGIVFLFALLRINRTREAWGYLAERTGLTLHRGSIFLNSPSLTGEYRGHPVKIVVRERSGDSGGSTVATLEVENPTLSRLMLSAEGLTGLIGRMTGARDVQVGDERFDRRMMISSDSPEFARAVLGDSSLRDQLMRLRGDFMVRLSAREMRFTQTRIQRDVDYMVIVLDALSDLADRVARTTVS